MVTVFKSMFIKTAERSVKNHKTPAYLSWVASLIVLFSGAMILTSSPKPALADADLYDVGGDGYSIPSWGDMTKSKRKYNKKTSHKKKLNKAKYSLGGKLPDGYIKSYNYKSGIEFDDPYLDGYRAKRYNKRYQRRVRGGYRTMCVRLKDGYYWPISFSQSRRGFKKDNVKCQKSCTDEVRLFYYNNHSDDIKNMRDLKGRRYAKLKTAFLYRKKYVAGAKCQPRPWSKEAKAKHQQYAVKDAKKKRRMHIAATRIAEKKRVAALKRKARRIARKYQRYSKKRARGYRRVARAYRRKKRSRRN